MAEEGGKAERKEERRISAGSYDLNKLLYGGYEKDIITTIYGPAGSGKTNFCLLAAVSQAKKGNKIIFIDTEGGFSVERVRQLAEESHEDVLKNIMLLKPVNFEEQKKSFSTLVSEIKGKGKIGLIVVDGMTMLYRLELSEASQAKNDEMVRQTNSELARQMRILAEIARLKNIPVIVTNQVYSEFLSEEDFRSGKRGVNMVGGDILRYWSKCLLELQNDRGRRRLIIRKHRSLPEKELSFVITNDGVRRRGWM